MLANETVDSAGNPVQPLPEAVQKCGPQPRPQRQGSAPPGPPDFESAGKCVANGLAGLGYRQHLAYQPASRFWPLQWLELACYLALSALLAWFCFRRLRHLS